LLKQLGLEGDTADDVMHTIDEDGDGEIDLVRLFVCLIVC
jgi:hypothetical protein